MPPPAPCATYTTSCSRHPPPCLMPSPRLRQRLLIRHSAQPPSHSQAAPASPSCGTRQVAQPHQFPSPKHRGSSCPAPVSIAQSVASCSLSAPLHSVITVNPKREMPWMPLPGCRCRFQVVESLQYRKLMCGGLNTQLLQSELHNAPLVQTEPARTQGPNSAIRLLENTRLWQTSSAKPPA